MDDDPIPDAQLDEWLRIAQDEDADSDHRTLGSQARNRRIKALVYEVRRERLVREVIERLYASEVNARVSFSWEWDGGYFWALGDEWNKFTDRGGHMELRTAISQLAAAAARRFPESDFARWWRGHRFGSGGRSGEGVG